VDMGRLREIVKREKMTKTLNHFHIV
jgi:hypothetical protein